MTVFMSTPADLLMRPGMHLGATRWIALHQRRIDQFADATGDLRWAHVHHSRAADSPFRSTVSHHSLVLALVPALLADLIQVGRGHVLFDLRIRSAEIPDLVSAGRRVRLRARVVTAAIVDGFVEATLEAVVEQDAERPPACVAIAVGRFAPPSGSPS